ncbi:hypothetical protein DAI22_01g134100 [Oryza sativa Japonica Group]|nr:hypothetical protein DAI22_01g134100 [Oryza sativa Japonica Group]
MALPAPLAACGLPPARPPCGLAGSWAAGSRVAGAPPPLRRGGAFPPAGPRGRARLLSALPARLAASLGAGSRVAGAPPPRRRGGAFPPAGPRARASLLSRPRRGAAPPPAARRCSRAVSTRRIHSPPLAGRLPSPPSAVALRAPPRRPAPPTTHGRREQGGLGIWG